MIGKGAVLWFVRGRVRVVLHEGNFVSKPQRLTAAQWCPRLDRVQESEPGLPQTFRFNRDRVSQGPRVYRPPPPLPTRPSAAATPPVIAEPVPIAHLTSIPFFLPPTATLSSPTHHRSRLWAQPPHPHHRHKCLWTPFVPSSPPPRSTAMQAAPSGWTAIEAALS